MKVINIVAAIALALVSGVALAERGSGEDNQIAYPESTSQQHSGAIGHNALADLPDRNR
ncbi:hypothetical protein J4377_16650 [Halomonas sp. XH26]|uniref:Uncharacterized protein n=1 Tax=Vreelandella alkaliphila TaxID=272774 RepID=A0AAJ2RWA0_9GAMM|nr:MULTISPECIES: hypothetical protein [Halomonas]EGP19960.1 hypothetical protein GME_08859 [Halomonas sp. TD01]MCD6005310.1 hypothetical protein [Halomonas sp. IOP_6]MCD6439411.1 hypothetical protein [Halomonas sp.]MDX5977584.1 hypothetical protein [Halomonas alkaliphila]UTA79546.1 hypothetical protein J4377_16650 [Halomonas sp. XH26]